MNDKIRNNHEVLLPAARVALFSHDADTVAAVQALAADWRFARVKFDVIEGDVAKAIETYKDEAAHNLIILQTDDINESFTGALETLAGFCDENTGAVVIGPQNDVNLYRKLIDMGVEDYLMRPVSTAQMGDIIAKTLIEQVGVGDARLIAFAGAKGGMGTSVLAQAMAWGVSEILGQKTIFLDAAGGWSTASVGMGFEPTTTLSEAARAAANEDEDSLNRMLYKAGDNLTVLASGGESMLDDAVGAKAFEKLLDILMVKYPVVIADLSGASSKLQKAIIARAHQINIISTATLPALRLARALHKEIKDVRGGTQEALSLLVNMHGMSSAHEVSKGDIEKAMGLKPAAYIPFEPKVFLACEAEGRKIIDNKQGLEILETTLLPLIRNVLAIDTDAANSKKDDGGFIGNILNKLRS